MSAAWYLGHLLAASLTTAVVVAAAREESPPAAVRDALRLGGIILACVAGLAGLLMLFEL